MGGKGIIERRQKVNQNIPLVFVMSVLSVHLFRGAILFPLAKCLSSCQGSILYLYFCFSHRASMFKTFQTPLNLHQPLTP